MEVVRSGLAHWLSGRVVADVQVLHPRAVKASLKTKTPIVARNTFSAAAGTTIFHHETDEGSKLVTLAHRENLALISFEECTDPQKIIPEIIRIDEHKFILKNDVYLENNLNLLRKSSLSSQQALVTAPNPISHPKGLHLAAHLENNARKITAHDKGLR